MKIKKKIKSILLGKKASSKNYVEYLRKRGAYIGDRTTFFSPIQISIDDTQPWLLEIGDDVQITGGVRILTHDYSWSVLKKVYGPIIGMAGKVKIGNNVFIGSDTTILGGTQIGDNVIIGAGSLVKGIIPSNCVAAGNPCKQIMTLEEYYFRRVKKYEDEAILLAKEYFIHYKKVPSKEVFHEFFFLFEQGDDLIDTYRKKLELMGNYETSMSKLKSFEHKYNNYDEFIWMALTDV